MRAFIKAPLCKLHTFSVGRGWSRYRQSMYIYIYMFVSLAPFTYSTHSFQWCGSLYFCRICSHPFRSPNTPNPHPSHCYFETINQGAHWCSVRARRLHIIYKSPCICRPPALHPSATVICVCGSSAIAEYRTHSTELYPSHPAAGYTHTKHSGSIFYMLF